MSRFATSRPTQRALVLNATFEPIGIISGRRAVVLALGNKVDVLAATERMLHSEHHSMALPTVVRLRYFVKVPYRRETPVTRKALFARDHHRCQYCNDTAENIDHVIPRSRGGRHVWTNVVASCRPCNTYKANSWLGDTKLRLRREPLPPHETAWIPGSVDSIPNAWDEYLHQRAA